MAFRFENFVARRYLTAKRRQAVISVITVISIIGVSAGVMALIIGLAITNGFRNTLQRSLLGATAHVSILEKETGIGLEDWPSVVQRVKVLPHVNVATPVLYGQVLFAGPQGQGGVLKGLPADSQELSELKRYIKQGSLDRLAENSEVPGVVLGSKLAQRTGMLLNARVTIISPNGDMTPLGPRPSYTPMRVVGIFETGFFDIDNSWGYGELRRVQRVMGVGDQINSIELRLDDLQLAGAVSREAEKVLGNQLTADTWEQSNKQIFNALKTDRIVTVITISLIQLVAALNILISLTMMVMEKTKDIAILVSMGARWEQVKRIFILQGLYIGAIGTAIGLALGYSLSWAAEHYRWFTLEAEVYALSYVPFEPRWVDGVWVAATAMAVSYLATLYPARQAMKVQPAEALRYE